MQPGRSVNDDGLIPAGALHLADAVTESLEPKPGSGCAQVHEQFVAFEVGHGAASQTVMSLFTTGLPIVAVALPRGLAKGLQTPSTKPLA